MNLSSIYTMKSLASALEINDDKPLIFLGLNEKIQLNLISFLLLMIQEQLEESCS